MLRFLRRTALPVLLLLLGSAQANVGLTELPGQAGDGPVTVYYPSSDAEQPVHHGRLELQAATDGRAQRGNGRLVVISHGSGGSPWVFANLARALVEAGFVVALPEHRADNYKDPSEPGPSSWKLRPAEVSRAIDVMAADPRFAPLLALDKVGVYGMSAGGHTVLSLAGGQWSPANFKRHCEAHLAGDFQFCVGLATQLTGSWLDGIRQWLALRIIRSRFSDEQLYAYEDKRIAAAVAAVPAAADFDMSTLAQPRIPLGLLTSGQDAWLHPQWHAGAVLKACLPRCEHLADLPEGGHGAYLSPLPPGFDGLEGRLLNDPPGFDRAVLPAVDARVVEFFQRHLLDAAPAQSAAAGSSLR